MERFVETRTAAAPIATCWAILTDPSRAEEWLTIASEVRAEGEPGPGRRLHARGTLLGVSLTTTQTVHLWEPPARYGWRGDSPLPMTVEVTLRDQGAGSTEVEAQVDADVRRLFPVGTRLALRAIRSQFARSADRLTALAEAES